MRASRPRARSAQGSAPRARAGMTQPLRARPREALGLRLHPPAAERARLRHPAPHTCGRVRAPRAPSLVAHWAPTSRSRRGVVTRHEASRPTRNGERQRRRRAEAHHRGVRRASARGPDPEGAQPAAARHEPSHVVRPPLAHAQRPRSARRPMRRAATRAPQDRRGAPRVSRGSHAGESSRRSRTRRRPATDA